MAYDPSTDIFLPDWLDQENFFLGGRDLAFDEFLNVSPEHQQQLVGWLVPLIDGDRQRARKAEAQARFEKVLGCITANAIVAMEANSAKAIHYSRDERHYVGSTPYKPDWLLSTQFLQTVDGLAKAGFLRSIKGTAGPGDLKRHQSTFRPTTAFQDALRERGFDQACVVRDTASAPVVWLRSHDGKNVSYTLNSLPRQALDLRTYNAFLKGLEITLALPDGVTCDRSPNLQSTSLRRIYNGNFDRGGRFYGGWWQAQPEEIREHITIGGEATVELDYSGLLPRALYHEAGIDYRDDPYDVPELRTAFEEAGISWAEGRRMVKAVFFLMLNARSRRGIHGSDAAKALPNTITPREAFEAIERHNEPIKDRFFSGYSMTLMQKESAICADILQSGLENGIPVISVHDSYIVRRSDVEWLFGKMISAYWEIFSHNPIVK